MATTRVWAVTVALGVALAWVGGCSDDSTDGAGGAAGAAGSGGSGNSGTGGSGGSGNSATGGIGPDGIIPMSRRIVWEGHVGVPGGIPARDTLRDCAAEDGAQGDGVTDDTAAIQSCVDATPAGSVAFLPAGTYLTTGTIQVSTGISVRGAGPTLTTIMAQSGSGNAIVSFAGDTNAYHRLIPLGSGYDQGSTSLVLTDASGLSVGDYLVVVQNNDDTTMPVSVQGTGAGGCTWCGFSLCSNDEDQPCDWDGLCSGGTCTVGGQLALGQLLKVTATGGNAVSIDPPLSFGYAAAARPRATRLGAMLERAGIENLRLDQSPASTVRYHVAFERCAECWVQNVESSYALNRHVIVLYGYRNEIRQSFFHDSDHYGQDHGYGIELGQYTAGTLIENNVFENVVLTLNIERGSSGNVVAYNYSHHIEYTNDPDAQMADWVTHGAHPYMNLFEGNIGRKVGHDNYWGSSSHHTWLRNALAAPEDGYTSQRNPVMIDAHTWMVNFVGNVFGRSDHGYTGYETTGVTAPDCYYGDAAIYRLGYYGGSGDCEWDAEDDSNVAATLLRHGNFDYFNQSVVWDPAIAEQQLPASLYLAAPPGWWPASCAWPPIGPDLDPMVGEIPAKRRFETGSEDCN